VIGQIPHLRAATADELQAFWDRHYVPGNAVLVIAGAVRHEDAEKLAETYFGWLPRCPDAPRIAEAEPAQTESREITIDEPNGPVPVAGIAFRTVPRAHADGPAVEVLANILGQGDSSRLHRGLVRKGVAMAAMAVAFQLEQAGFIGAGAAVSPFGDPKRAMAAIEEEVQRFRDEEASEAEIEKARNALLKDQVTALLRIEYKARLLGEAATILGDAEEANRQVDRYRNVSAADVRRVAREYLTPERRTTVMIRPTLMGMLKTFLGGGKGAPEDEGAAPPRAEALAGVRAKPTGPKATAVRPSSLPEKPPIQPPLREVPKAAFSSKTLANGLKVVAVPNREVPFVTMSLDLRHGAAHEDPARPGAAAMACSMLVKGTAKHTADQLAGELERLAIDIGGSASHDDASVFANALSDQFERAMAYLAEVVQSPTFPPEELETYRNEVRASLMVEEKEPGYQAERKLEKAIFGEHPYSRPAGGTLEDLNRLSAEDVSKWWKTFARPDAAVLYIAGDVDEKRAFEAAEASFGAWKAPDAPIPPLKAPSIPTPSPTKILLVDRPGSYQSEIRVGHLGVPRRHPEMAKLDVLDQVFGGSFGARLNATLRVKKGLTYGIQGGFSPRKEAGAFRIRTFSKTPATAEAVRTILEEIDRLQAEPPTEQELDIARSYLTGSFARERETPQAVAGDLWMIESNGLPPDYFEKHLDEAARTTSEDTARLARSLIQPKSLVIIIVGEAERIRADLEKIAPVTVVKP
jgi:zinc protease